jgi:hypothetical protein
VGGRPALLRAYALRDGRLHAAARFAYLEQQDRLLTVAAVSAWDADAPTVAEMGAALDTLCAGLTVFPPRRAAVALALAVWHAGGAARAALPTLGRWLAPAVAGLTARPRVRRPLPAARPGPLAPERLERCYDAVLDVDGLDLAAALGAARTAAAAYLEGRRAPRAWEARPTPR